MDSNRDKDNIQRMLELAEFGAKRHDDRRTVEFRIFVSYMTPLILAFYYLIKLDVDLFESISWGLIVVGSIVYLLTIHLVYVLWQIGVAIAMANDAWRRNFYLKKVECILHHQSKNLNVPFSPSNDIITVNCGYEKTQMTEKKLFKKSAANLILVRNFWELFKHFNQTWKDWSRMFVVAIPTILVLLLIGTLLFEKLNWLP